MSGMLPSFQKMSTDIAKMSAGILRDVHEAVNCRPHSESWAETLEIPAGTGLAIVTCVSIKVAGASDPKGPRTWRNKPLSCFSRQSSLFKKESVMESVTEKKSEGQIAVPSLNVEAMNKALAAAQDQTATKNYPVTIKLYERYGRAYISWDLPSNFPMGTKDMVALFEGGSLCSFTQSVGEQPSGTIDTGRAWGSGLSALYWSVIVVDKKNDRWELLVETPKT